MFGHADRIAEMLQVACLLHWCEQDSNDRYLNGSKQLEVALYVPVVDDSPQSIKQFLPCLLKAAFLQCDKVCNRMDRSSR